MKKYKNTFTACFLLFTSIGISSCNSNKIDATVPKTSETVSFYAHPETISFSPKHLSLMLRQTYLNLAYSYPPTDDIASIEGSANVAEAKENYDTAIQTLMDSGVMEQRLKDYFFQASGIGSKNGSGGPDQKGRYPANIFAYVILNGKPMSELILGTYSVGDNGVPFPQGLDYSSGVPLPESIQAGYLTTQKFVEGYMNAFQFAIIREILGMNLLTKAPFTGVDLYRWNDELANAKYEEDVVNNLVCSNCHAAMNPLRGAFQEFNGANQTYVAGLAQGNDQYKQEEADAGGDTLEPRKDDGTDDGEPMTPAEAASHYKLTENGSPIASPRDLALEISKHPRFAVAWTTRLLTILLNLDKGSPGVGNVIPDPFSGNDAQVEYLDKWVTKFNELEQIPKDFIVTFLQSPDYLIVGCDPTNDCGTE